MITIINDNNAFDGISKTAQIDYNDLSVQIYKFIEQDLVPRINYYYEIINKLEKYYVQLNKVKLSDESKRKNNQAYAILINKIEKLKQLFNNLNSTFNSLPDNNIELKQPKKKKIKRDFNYVSPRDLADNINYTLNEIQNLPDDEDLFIRGEELVDF